MKVTDKHVLFWGGRFSNFELTPFRTTEHEFLTNEHYFMFCKARFFNDTEVMEQILKVEHPRDAKALGRKVKNFNADKWTAVCRSFMTSGLRLKFGTNPVLSKEIMKYPNKSFVECSPYDKIWGIGLSEEDPRADDETKWLGTNWLGQCLDKVRDELITVEKYNTGSYG